MPSPFSTLMLSGPRRPRDRRRNPLWRFRRALFLLGLFGVGGLLGSLFVLSRIELDLADDNIFDLAQTGFICAADITGECGPENAIAQLSAGEDRELVNYEDIPEVVIWAVVATEDKDYFTHHGVDPVGIARAMVQNVREQDAVQGGSTITQQYVKNTFTGDDQTLIRKVREATLAIKLNRQLSKEELLERYLNRIYFGRGAYGIQAAAQAYFGKNVGELDIADAAFLAGLIRSPGTADPARDPEEAARRRATSLTRMMEDGYITQAEADEANSQDWSNTVRPPKREGLGEVAGSAFGTEYFVEAVRQQLALLEPEGELYTGGLRVYTTLDPEVQRAAFISVTEVVDPRSSPDDPSASVVAVDAKGQVVAMMGGFDFSTSQVNLALGRQGGGSGRQPGSSFKPFALAEALEQGFSARSLFSAPSSIVLPGANDGADWTVGGGGSPDGYRDLVDALRVSSNVVYAQLMVALGPQSVVGMAERLGVSAPLPAVNSLVLGSGEVSVLDMAAAYSTIANQGVRYAPILIERVEFADGRPTCWYPIDGECTGTGPGREPTDAAALDPSIARQVTAAMQGVVEAGTGGAAQFGQPAAGKTGTTQDNRDAWFVGFTCQLSAAVWMGYPGTNGQTVQPMDDVRGIEVSGGNLPAEIWSAFMARTMETSWGGASGPCEQLATSTDYTGIVLNPDLSTTTLPPCVEPSVTTEDAGPIPTIPGGEPPTAPADSASIPTTQPCQPVLTDVVPDGGATDVPAPVPEDDGPRTEASTSTETIPTPSTSPTSPPTSPPSTETIPTVGG